MRFFFFPSHTVWQSCHYQHTLVYRFCSPGAANDSSPKFEVILNVSLAHSLAFPPYVMLSLDPHVPEALWLWLGSRCSGALPDSMFHPAGVGRFFSAKLRWEGRFNAEVDRWWRRTGANANWTEWLEGCHLHCKNVIWMLWRWEHS